MEVQRHHNMIRDRFEASRNDVVKLTRCGKEADQPPPVAAATAAASPTSSPSHEFSFTISLHPSATTTTTATATTTSVVAGKSKAVPPSIAIDLSPADEIFFHGHLLPLHLLSHLPVSPRSSTHSLDGATTTANSLPKAENQSQVVKNSPDAARRAKDDICLKESHAKIGNGDDGIKVRPKSKSFSLFGGLSRWKKGNEGSREKNVDDKDQRHTRRMSFDVSHVLRRYMKMVRPLFRGRSSKEKMIQFQRETHSFSGNLGGMRGNGGWRQQQEFIRGKRAGEYSAPASMGTSPTNSGLLVATGAPPSSSSASDSTMEELQAAIQAAIAHCKNSISTADEKSKVPAV